MLFRWRPRGTALHLPLDEPLSAAQFTDITGSDVAVPGCGNVEGCYNVVQIPNGGGLQGDGRFPAVDAGSSFIMVADMSPHGPSAQTMVTRPCHRVPPAAIHPLPSRSTR